MVGSVGDGDPGRGSLLGGFNLSNASTDASLPPGPELAGPTYDVASSGPDDQVVSELAHELDLVSRQLQQKDAEHRAVHRELESVRDQNRALTLRVTELEAELAQLSAGAYTPRAPAGGDTLSARGAAPVGAGAASGPGGLKSIALEGWQTQQWAVPAGRDGSARVFPVNVLTTRDSKRLQLDGPIWVAVGKSGLSLFDRETHRMVKVWTPNEIRQYQQDDDMLLLSTADSAGDWVGHFAMRSTQGRIVNLVKLLSSVVGPVQWPVKDWPPAPALGSGISGFGTGLPPMGAPIGSFAGDGVRYTRRYEVPAQYGPSDPYAW